MITSRRGRLRWYERVVFFFLGVGICGLLFASAVRETLWPRPWGQR